MIKIKICGLTNIEDALMCSREGADALGFIFSKKSPRYISEAQAKKITEQLDPFTCKIGVFLDEEKEVVLHLIQSLKLHGVQFHGNESPGYCNFFKQYCNVIKVFFPGQKPLQKIISSFSVDAYSLDIKYEEKEQGKVSLPKQALREAGLLIKEGRRIIISGGLNVKNIGRVVKLQPYGVDVASGLEEFVGKKDKRLVRDFIQEVKHGSSQ
ncbi:MAG: phosphoribosylanthranilate isomerase [Candidatus Omnitrophica bacterium]|nr:phosphoribosylanthranilate isomerase [Candidatus Omnitrophota bacterium]